LIEYTAKTLVDNTGCVRIREKEGGKMMVSELKVGKGHMGRIAGRRTNIPNGIRMVVTGASMRKGKRAILE